MAATSIISPNGDDKPIVENEYRPGKFLTFRVASRDFAMNIGFVRGILPMHQMVPAEIAGQVPVCGFAAVEGRDFPVIDLGAKLGIDPGIHGREPFIIVIESCEKLVGFVAERLSEILDLRARHFKNGMVITKGRPRQVLAPSQIMTDQDWSALTANSPTP
jgi:chemotaxis signal transduction protein